MGRGKANEQCIDVPDSTLIALFSFDIAFCVVRRVLLLEI
jgi:hypothetical protein